MFCCPHCGLTLHAKGTTVVLCGCEKSIESERLAKQERENFKRLQKPDLARRKRSNYKKD